MPGRRETIQHWGGGASFFLSCSNFIPLADAERRVTADSCKGKSPRKPLSAVVFSQLLAPITVVLPANALLILHVKDSGPVWNSSKQLTSCTYLNLTTESYQSHAGQERKSRASISPGVGVLALSSSVIQPAPHRVLMSKAKFCRFTKARLAERGKLSLCCSSAGEEGKRAIRISSTCCLLTALPDGSAGDASREGAAPSAPQAAAGRALTV